MADQQRIRAWLWRYREPLIFVAVMGVMVLLSLPNLLDIQRNGEVIERHRQAREAEARRAEEYRRTHLPRDTIRASKQSVRGSHELILTNSSELQLGRCDITLTVYLQTGERPQIRRYWTDWAPGEDKLVSVSGRTPIERVDVSGTVAFGAAGHEKKLDMVFEWKAPQTTKPGG